MSNQEVFLYSALQAAEVAYGRIAEAQKIPLPEVHRHEVCSAASSIMFNHELMRQDPNLTSVDRLIFEGDEIGIAWQHTYLLQRSEDGNDVIIDPTWQQFLPGDKVTDDLPKVLFGTREEVIEQARKAGVPELALDYWKTLSETSRVKRERIWPRYN